MAKALAAYLRSVQHPKTGLVESFGTSADPSLRNVAFTYDLALASLVFTHHQRFDEAGRLLELYRRMPLPNSSTFAFNVAYHIEHRQPTLEYAFQGGPLFWIAIALMRYAEATGSTSDLQRAVELVDWARTHLAHFRGGVVMGTQKPWNDLMSGENNWAYYAALRLAIQRLPEGPPKAALIEEKRGVRQWLSRNQGNRGEDDPVKALDVYTNALLVGPEAHLEDGKFVDRHHLAKWAKNWVAELEELFRIPGRPGYDYTDHQEATRVGRNRAGWLEGTEQVVLAYQTWAPFFEALGDLAFAQELRLKAALAYAHVIRHSLVAANSVAIPNTDSPEPFQTFSDGWYARPWTEPALNSTTWAYFAEVGYNPFIISLPRTK